MSNFFSKLSNFFDKCVVSLLLAAVALGVAFLAYRKDTGFADPVKMTVLEEDTLQFLGIQELNTESILWDAQEVKLPQQSFVHQGEVVTVIGADDPEAAHDARFLIEKEDGTRGLVPHFTMEKRGVMVKASEDHHLELGDSIEILAVKPHKGFCSKVTVRNLRNDSIAEDVPGKNLVTSTIDSLNEHILNSDACSLMSMRQFEEGFLNTTTADSVVRDLALSIVEWKDTLRMPLALKVFDAETGMFFRPILLYGKDGACVGFSRRNCDTYWNAWILKYLPGASWIFEQRWLTAVLDKPMFEKDEMVIWKDLGASGAWGTVLGIVALICVGLVLLVWICSFGLVVPLLLVGLIRFRYIYLPFGNNMLKYFIMLISLVWAYMCMVVMLSYCYWFIYIPVTLYLLDKVFGVLNEVLWSRCTKCGRLDSIHMISDELQKEDISSHYEERFAKTTNRWKSFASKYVPVRETKTTTRNGVVINQESRIIQQYAGTERIEHGTNVYDKYEVLYKNSYYLSTYECDGCHHVTYDYHVESKKVDEQKVGQTKKNY